MTREPALSADAFEAAYAERSGVSVAGLRASGRVVCPCDCGMEGCRGWMSVSLDVANMLAYERVGLWDVISARGEVYMPFTHAQLEEIFTYHAPTSEQIEHYAAVRAKALELAEVIVTHTPVSPDQSVAIRKLRECVHVANGAIALEGKF